MAIAKGNKIIANEINVNLGTNFKQQNLIYANDIANIYGGSDTIARGVLIKEEHFLNIGLPGSGGLNGYYDGVLFKEAEANRKIFYDANGGILYLQTAGEHEIEFTNFGNLTSNVDIFMVGGGGMGNKNGLSGSGGFYNTFLNKTLVQSTPYNLNIGYGGRDGEPTGGKTAGFGFEVTGGYSGAAHIFKGYYKEVAVYSVDGANVYFYNKNFGQDEYGNTVIDYGNDDGHLDNGDIVNIKCNQNGNLVMSNPIGREGENVPGILLHAQDGTLYLVGSYNVESSDTLTDMEYTQRPSDEPVATTIFTTTIWVSGYVKPVSNPGANTDLDATRWGQGGGGSNIYGGSFYGQGGNGVIAIRKKV